MSENQPELAARFIGSEADLETRPPKQRRYTAAYKLRLIERADACIGAGELASLLRQEGVYSSTLAEFRKQKARGDLDCRPVKGVTPKSTAVESATLKQLAASEREVRRLRRELEKARVLLDLQKKVADLMNISLDSQE